MPAFSLVLPTAPGRAETFRHALATMLAQEYDDFEVVVQSNGDDPRVREIIEHLDDPRIRFFSTAAIIPMSANWELAVDHAKGDFVTVLGDDDGLLPDACSTAEQILERSAASLLDWRPPHYFWPGYFDQRRQDHLEILFDPEFVVRTASTRPLLERFYDFAVLYVELPSIYWGFVDRKLIENIKRTTGQYFHGILPDVCSAITNAASSPKFVRSTRPLSVNGSSKHSTGHSQWIAGRPDADYLAKHFSGIDKAIYEGARWNLALLIAEEMRFVKETLFPHDDRLSIGAAELLRFLAATINEWQPHLYGETCSLILELAERFGISFDSRAIPPNKDRDPLEIGLHRAERRRWMFVIDCAALGVNDIFGAVTLARQLEPGPSAAVFGEEVPRPRLGSEEVKFSADSAGAVCLREGWSEPEDWGTWTIGPRATVQLELSDPYRRTRLVWHARALVVPGQPNVTARCLVAGRLLGSWELDVEHAELVIDLPESLAAPEIETVFEIEHCRSPRDAGIGDDPRPLGIGLEGVRTAAPLDGSSR